MYVPFIGGGYLGRSSDLNAQVCKNLYPVLDKTGGKNVAALFGTPGLTEFCDTGNAAEVRNIHVVGSYLYAVVGNTLYKINSAGSATTITGSLSGAASGPVWMADDGVELMVVAPGVDGYIYETVAGGNLTAIADGDFPTPETNFFLDGYIGVTESDTGKFWIPTAYDATAWDALDYATAERSPDNIISSIVHRGQLVLLGPESIEGWFNSGAADFPFENIATATEGIGAAASIARDEESIYFLSSRGTVVRTVGYQLQRVSTDSIDYIISTYSDISDARGFVYTQEGHRFYVLNFPTSGNTQATLVYDITTGFWHTRESWLATPLPPVYYGQWRANCYAQFGTDRIIGDYENGKLYKLDMDVYADDGEDIERTRAAQAIHKDRLNIFHHSFEVDFESGVGLASGQGSDPQAVMDYSDDGGHTWSSESWGSLGTNIGGVGEYTTRVKWSKLGRSRNRIYRVTVTDPVKVVMINAHLRATVGLT